MVLLQQHRREKDHLKRITSILCKKNAVVCCFPAVTLFNSWRDKLTRSASVCEPSPLVHISMTEYEQNVTRTLYWLTAASHRDALLSNSSGGTRIDWWPEYTLKQEDAGERVNRNPQKEKIIICVQIFKCYWWSFVESPYLHRHQRAKPRPQYGSRQMAICRDG